jgi:hypothetical protein
MSIAADCMIIVRNSVRIWIIVLPRAAAKTLAAAGIKQAD